MVPRHVDFTINCAYFKRPMLSVKNLLSLVSMTQYQSSSIVFVFFLACFLCSSFGFSQTKLIEGKEYKPYSPRYFKPKFTLRYNLYVSPILTVDPLGIGGKSAYALSAGTRINLWESKIPIKSNAGLKVNGWYIGGGYEFFPQQYDKIYGSLWIRIKTFMQFVGRMDAVYSYGYGVSGIGSRYCAGFEIKKISIMCNGELFFSNQPDHPRVKSKYFNQAAIFVIIPIYTKK
jgi:hypothetical protein